MDSTTRERQTERKNDRLHSLRRVRTPRRRQKNNRVSNGLRRQPKISEQSVIIFLGGILKTNKHRDVIEMEWGKSGTAEKTRPLDKLISNMFVY